METIEIEGLSKEAFQDLLRSARDIKTIAELRRDNWVTKKDLGKIWGRGHTSVTAKITELIEAGEMEDRRFDGHRVKFYRLLSKKSGKTDK